MNCEEVRSRIARLSVDELEGADRDQHVATCADCQGFWQDMVRLSNGLQGLTIPRPSNMRPPIVASHPRRVRVMTLLAATLAMLLLGALLANMFKFYFMAENSDGPGTRESVLYHTPFGKSNKSRPFRKAESPPNEQSERAQSKSLPSNPSRN
jgi:hypothetical protein